MNDAAAGLLLLPAPQRAEWSGGTVDLPADGLLLLEAGTAMQDVLPTARLLQAALRAAAGGDWPLVAGDAGLAGAFAVALNLVPGSVPHPEGYSLTLGAERIDAVAATPAGLFYAVQTLRQIARQAGHSWPRGRIVDWPDFPNRGVMLDVSRDRVPTTETLYALVDLFAALKYNQLQFYTEHTFAYRKHPQVWANASPLTGDEILALDAYCRARHIELVPNQNTFGHMRRWLTLDAYRDLAEAPEGCNTRWGWFAEPFSLNPGDPRSLALVVDLLDELLPHFSSRQVNVGLDETVDLGEGRSRAAVAERGVGAVFFEFLLKVYREVKRRGRTMQLWGDIIMEYPELAAQLPRDVVALEWGYEADHPFDAHSAQFAASGVPFYVCPGTSRRNSVAGRTDNALANLRRAADAGRAHGAVGYLVTDWGDNGHWQPPAVSLLPFAYGAGQAWSGVQSAGVDLPRAADRLLFDDEDGVLGRVAYELGRVDLLLETDIHNTAALFAILQGTPEEVRAAAAQRGGANALLPRLDAAEARLHALRADLAQARPRAEGSALVVRELAWAADLLAHACRRGRWLLGDSDASTARALAADADRLIEEYSLLWHARSRPGGFPDSVARLHALRDAYGASAL
jgi:hypothetical protein